MKKTKKSTIKTGDLINYIFGKEMKFTKEDKSTVEKLTPYVFNSFICKPTILIFINKNFNNMFAKNKPTAIEMLDMLRVIVYDNKITKNDLWFMGYDRKSYELEDFLAQTMDSNDAKSKALMYEIINGKYKSKSKQEANSENKEKVKLALKKAPKDERFLNELTQELIDELDLIFFDIHLLKLKNEILFIFIDKNNKKRYYKLPFYAEVYLSKSNSILDNDYILKLDSDKFVKLVFNDYKILNKLKYTLSANYERNLNLRF